MLREQMTGFITLEGQTYAALTTFRRDGQPVTRPVRFAQDGDKVYVALVGAAETVEQIHFNAQVEIAPCSERGEALGASMEAMAVILTDANSASARQRLQQKVGWQRRLGDLLHIGAKPVYLEITAM